MTTFPSRRCGAQRLAGLRGSFALALLPLMIGLSACGQQGPLRHPWETSHEARDNAAARRVPLGTRSDLPSAADDATSSQVRP